MIDPFDSLHLALIDLNICPLCRRLISTSLPFKFHNQYINPPPTPIVSPALGYFFSPSPAPVFLSFLLTTPTPHPNTDADHRIRTFRDHGSILWQSVVPSATPTVTLQLFLSLHLHGSFRRSFNILIFDHVDTTSNDRTLTTADDGPFTDYFFSTITTTPPWIIPAVFLVNSSHQYQPFPEYSNCESRSPSSYIMPEPAVSWNEVHGIHFSFGYHFRWGNKQWKLNAAFAQTLPNIASLFIVDEHGVETLRPDPIPVLKSLIVAAIVDELPASQVFKAHKQRIALLLSNSAIFCHKIDHGRFRVRDKHGLDNAARRANTEDSIIRLVLTIFSWKFHEDWYPDEFHKVYNPGYGVPLDAAMLQRKTPFHTQTNNELKFNDKLIEQLKREWNGETVYQVLPPKQKHRTKPTAPVVSETLPVPSCPTIVPSGATDLVQTKTTVLIPRAGASPVTANLGPLQPVGPIADSPSVKAPRYIWTWTYSPNSESVSFRRVKSDSVSFKCAASFSPPVQQQDKSPVTAPSVTPSHHSVPPYVPANFRWTFNPQNETVTFHRLPKPAPVPLKPPSRFPSSAATANDPPVLLRLSKRHRDALKIKMYHLYANILSMNWFYDTFD
eukprot:jgi/Psemu1/51205/gm1.51205_g